MTRWLDKTRVDPRDPEARALFANLQANILKGHGRENSACLFLRFSAPPADCKRWIADFARRHVTSALGQHEQTERYRAARAQGAALDEPGVCFFLSAAGYRALGLDVARFGKPGRAFRRGMKHRPRTALEHLGAAFHHLFDHENKDPDPVHWEDGFQDEIHAMILIAQDDAAGLEQSLTRISESLAATARILTVERGHMLREAAAHHAGHKGQPIEHFGFADGRSNPVFLRDDVERETQRGVDEYDPSAPLSLALTPDPFAPDADSYGSYLVFRKLQQDVARFHAGAAALAKALHVSPDYAGALAVGRFRDGTPLTMQQTDGLPNVPNNFNYAGDENGARCPAHAHIRKANPRSTGLRARLTNDRARRIVRRGIPYGDHDQHAEPGQPVGLLFMCYQADIRRQYEHIQRRWADNRAFPALWPFARTGVDPLIGQTVTPQAAQRWPLLWGGSQTQRLSFGGYVGLRGGEYLFAPSLSFLRSIDHLEGGKDMSDDARAETGAWQLLPYDSEIEAVHVGLLHTGKVLYYSGFRVAEHVPTQTRVWNPRTGEIKAPHTPSDLFCAGHAFLPDGRFLSTGGTLEYRDLPAIPAWLIRLSRPIAPFVSRTFLNIAKRIPALRRVSQFTLTGSTQLYLFNPESEAWEYGGDMPEGRWYPTNTCLPDGRVLLLSGTNEGGKRGEKAVPLINRRIEVFDPVGGLQQVGTITPTFAPQHGSSPGSDDPAGGAFPTVYPRMHVLPVADAERADYPAGKAFCAGYGKHSKMLNLHTWEWTDVADLNFSQRDDGCSVLLPLRPPDYRARIITFGGWRPGGFAETDSTATAEIINFGEEHPEWRFTESMAHKRLNASAVLLPDGKVMVIGGNSTGQFDDPVFAIQVFDPDTEHWQTVAPMTVPRRYHSTALLLPDGRVLSAGTTPLERIETRMEVYSPYYLFRGARPTLENAPAQISYGQPFEVTYTCAEGSLRRAALIRPGAVTHAFDMDQRYVELSIERSAGATARLIAPPDVHIAPPGYYMLFLLNERDVPSEAAFVRLMADAAPSPPARRSTRRRA